MHSLTERAMVMNLSIGVWQGYRLDKAATQKVTDDAGAASDAARVNKHLVPKAALANVVKASGAVRTHFYEKTLPWRDNGDRLMTRALYMPFIEKHAALVGEFDAAVSKFLDEDYPAAIEQAEFRMGTMFNRDDYPPVQHLRRKFYATLDIAAVSQAGDFRVDLDQDQLDNIRKSIESSLQERIDNAQRDLWRRLAETVGYFHERMAKPDAVFRDSTVENIRDLIELVPGLNVTDDPEIEEIRKMVAKSLLGIDPKDIRKDPEFRKELAGEAGQIMNKMAGFMRAFSAGDE